MIKRSWILATAIAGVVAAAQVNAAEVVLFNLDVPGVGLNDTTPAEPVGRNPGTTVGDQRIAAYLFASKLWGQVIKSDVEIKVYASFAPLRCDATSGVLGSAGPNWLVRDFPGAVPNTFYVSALGDAIAKEDLVPDPADPGDIGTRFNGNLGQPGCLEAFGWYYGLDGKTPAGQINFLNVVMHEIAHGLGFLGLSDVTTGQFFQNIPDIYNRQVFDNVLKAGFADPGILNENRAQAMRTPGRTVWNGKNVNRQARLILDELVKLRTSAKGEYDFGRAEFGETASDKNFTGEITAASDGATPGPSTACVALPADSLKGKIAFVNRGTCGFEVKALNAQNAGATAVIIGNVETSANPATPPGMLDDPTVEATIPAISLNLADASAVRTGLASSLTASLFTIAGQYVGTDSKGRARLYAPETVAPGSTFSHFDTVTNPNALMEPSITSTLNAQFNVDLTPALFQDLGWGVSRSSVKISKCNTGVRASARGGLILGANVVASNFLCEVANSKDPVAYLGCMRDYADALSEDKVLTTAEAFQVTVCSAKRTVELINAQQPAK